MVSKGEGGLKKVWLATFTIKMTYEVTAQLLSYNSQACTYCVSGTKL